MFSDRIRAEYRRAIRRYQQPDKFLKKVDGVIHVGANEGQERDLYAKLGLQVLWVEPIPAVFKSLESNIANYPLQRGAQALLTDIDDKQYDFYISNNSGVSSSILELEHHRDLWPSVTYTESISLRSATLPKLLEREGLSPSMYQALVMDTQGSELLVLKGAEDIIGDFAYIKTEVADFESYRGCCTLSEMTAYLKGFGFKEIRRTKFAGRREVGSYYDVVYGHA